MSGLLAAIGCALLGLAVGAALQRWGDADKATHGHKEYLRSELHEQIADKWTGW